MIFMDIFKIRYGASLIKNLHHLKNYLISMTKFVNQIHLKLGYCDNLIRWSDGHVV